MRTRTALLVACALMLAIALSSCASRRPTNIAAQAPAAPALTPEQQKVVDYLVSHWGRELNVNGVSLAMGVVGGGDTAIDRYAVGVHLKEHPELHRRLRTFGWETVALDPLEKRIARGLSRADREQKPAPSLNELGQLLQETPGAVTSGLRMLERFGIIRRESAAGGVGYRMAEERYVDWEGAMRITFMDHRVHVDGLNPFNVY